MHDLALRVGAWRGETYAPFPGKYAPGVRPARAVAGYSKPPFPGSISGKSAPLIMPMYLRNALRPGNVVNGVPWRERIYMQQKMGAATYFGSGIRPSRSWATRARQERSYVPPPKIDGPSALNRARIRMQAQVSAPKMPGTAGREEPTPSLSQRLHVAMESRGEPRDLKSYNTREGRFNAGLSTLAEDSAFHADFGDALEEYFFQQSRLAPSGGAAFNPRLSPLWSGLKLPG